MNKETIEVLEVGDWVNMQYGLQRYDFYVTRIVGEMVWFGKPGWLTSSTVSLTWAELNHGYYSPIFIGPSRRRWWRWLLLPFAPMICPFTNPIDVNE